MAMRLANERRQAAPLAISVLLLFLLSSVNGSISGPCHLPSTKNVAHIDMPFRLSVEVHHEINLVCRLVRNTIQTAEGNITVDASNLRFKIFDRQGDFLDTKSPFVEKLDESAIAFVKPNAEVDDSGPYTCVAQIDTQPKPKYFPGCIASVEVGTRPQNVIDFLCTATAFLNMTCSWTNPDNGRIPTNYTIEVIRGLHMFNQWMPCPANHTTDNSCTWTTGTDPYFEKYAKKFKFRLNGTNSIGHESWNFEFDHNAILKLTPVTNLAYNNLTQRGVVITWTKPAEAEHRTQKKEDATEKILYEIALRREGAQPKMGISSASEQVMYDDLVPNKEYTLEVRCHMDKATRFDLYSEPTTISFKTPKDRPDRPPMIYQSGFRSKIYTDRRTITLVFTEIDPDAWNDDTFNYIIQVCPRFGNFDDCTNRTESHSMTDIEDLSTQTRYEVTIWSNNSIDTSERSSSMIIFSQSEVLSSPQDISAVLFSDSASITWRVPKSLQDDADKLETVLYWCKSVIEDACNGTIQTKVLSGPITSGVINVTQPRDYIYGVALSNKDTGCSSGVVWSTCVSQADAYVGLVRELKADSDTDTSIKLHWAKMCSSQRKYIGGYQAEYCHVDRQDASSLVNSNDECQRHTPTASVNGSNVYSSGSTSCQTKNFTLDDNEAEYTVTGLTKGETYRVVVRVLDGISGRFAPDSAAVCAIANGGMAPMMVIGIGVGCTLGLLVFVVALSVFVKWIHRKVEGAKEVKATLPPPLQKEGGAGYSDFIARVNGCNKNGHSAYTDQHNGDITILSDFTRGGSHSSLDNLIIENAPVVTVETPAMIPDGDFRESTNLNGEPNSLEDPSPRKPTSTRERILPSSRPLDPSVAQSNGANSPMPPYTQLGLSVSQLAAGAHQVNGHGPHAHNGITGYSQLSVTSDPPSPDTNAAPDVVPRVNTSGPSDNDEDEESGGSLDDDNVTDRSPLHSPRRSPTTVVSASARAVGYVPADRAMAAPMSHPASAAAPLSNGYVPFQRANQ